MAEKSVFDRPLSYYTRRGPQELAMVLCEVLERPELVGPLGEVLSSFLSASKYSPQRVTIRHGHHLSNSLAAAIYHAGKMNHAPVSMREIGRKMAPWGCSPHIALRVYKRVVRKALPPLGRTCTYGDRVREYIKHAYDRLGCEPAVLRLATDLASELETSNSYGELGGRNPLVVAVTLVYMADRLNASREGRLPSLKQAEVAERNGITEVSVRMVTRQVTALLGAKDSLGAMFAKGAVEALSRHISTKARLETDV